MRLDLARCLRMIAYGFNDCTIPTVAITDYMVQDYGSVGRRKIILNMDAIDLMRTCGFRWNYTTKALQVSRTTLWRRLTEVEYQFSRYTDISDDELDYKVSKFMRVHPNYGQQSLMGYLRAEGIHVQRYTLREVLHEHIL